MLHNEHSITDRAMTLAALPGSSRGIRSGAGMNIGSQKTTTYAWNADQNTRVHGGYYTLVPGACHASDWGVERGIATDLNGATHLDRRSNLLS